MAIQIQLRRDTDANWTSNNPTLAEGEAGYATDTYEFKVGDGSTPWNSLPGFTTTSGITNHGELDGLAEDDHTQYHTDARGDARYYTQSQVDTISGSLSSEIDSDITTHASSADHDGRYYTETELDNGQLDNRYYTESEVDTISGSLSDEIDSTLGQIIPAISNHVADTNNPHSVDAADVGSGTATWNASHARDILLPAPTAGDDDYYLQYDHGGTQYVLVSGTGGGGGLAALSDDPSPQLGGDLDTNSYDIDFGTDTISGTGTIVTGDHGAATKPETVNVIYGTGDPPTASTTTIGTLYIKYTA